MAICEIVKPREIVKAGNGLFRCKYKIKDVVAARIFMTFASLVNHNDIKENQSFVEYQISASSIIQDINAGGDYYKQIRDAAYSLIDHKIEQRFDKNNFAVYTLFSKIEYRDGIIKGEFHRDLMPFFIIAKERFTKMKLNEYMLLPSVYSQCIFSFLKSWDDKKEISVKVSQLHDMLDTPKSVKSNFAEFRRRILDKAYRDINEKTSLSYEWEPIKRGRSVDEIKFIFSKKLRKHTSNNHQAVAFLQSALGNCVPFSDTKQGHYEAFLNKFPNGGRYRYNTWKIWFTLYDEGKAPFDKDVSGNLNPVEFLEQWQKLLLKENNSI